ncbi:MAG: tyrosine--tRNA ligase [Candidatus Levybacteria bacterium]|nr:tyrosine--tRNA ligase [Candidatus Levybacteria bacterium]
MGIMDKIEELLTRGVDTIYPTKEELEKVLRSGKKLTLYQGFDPTGTQLHIGHMIGLKKLRQWQDLGHHVIFLIGDGTGQAGDPSGKLTARDKFLTREELRKNATDYVKQAGKIMRFEGENPIEIRFNGDWLNKLTLVDILEILGHLSLQQLEERDLFEKRKKNGQTVNMREFIYPILQGYDSVAMEVDLELGGSDQMFNMLIGRQLLKAMKQKDKFVMTTPLLADSEGRKIGKTEGNVIALTDTPNELYGKLLTLPDEVIIKGFEYLTNVPMDEIKKYEKSLKEGENPMIYKKKLALEITKDLHSEEASEKAQEHFEKTVQQKELPTEITEVTLDAGDEEMVNEVLLVALNLASSKAEAKRLFEQNGVEVNSLKIQVKDTVAITDGMIIKVGKRKIVRIKMSS